MILSLFDLSLYPLGPLFWGGEQCSWMSDCRARGEAEESTTLPQHNLHCGWVWLQSGCSGGKTAQGEGKVLLQLGVTAACFSVCDIPNLGFLIRRPIALFIPSILLQFLQWQAGLIYDLVKIHHSLLHCVSLQDEILRDTEKLQKELERLMKEYENAAQQRILLRQELQDDAEVVVINAIATNKLE